MNIKNNIIAANLFMWAALLAIFIFQVVMLFTKNDYQYFAPYILPLISSAFYMLGANYVLMKLKFKKSINAFFTALLTALVESFLIFIVIFSLSVDRKAIDTSLFFLFVTPSVLLMIVSKLTINKFLIKEHLLGNFIGLAWCTGILFLSATDFNGKGVIPLDYYALIFLTLCLLIPSGIPHSFLISRKI